MIERFFSNVLADQTCEENLKSHIEAAYAVTLKQYHNWLIQKSFSVSHDNSKNPRWNVWSIVTVLYVVPFQLIYTVLPSRSQLIGCGEAHSENLQALKVFLDSMRVHLNEINAIVTNWHEGNAQKPCTHFDLVPPWFHRTNHSIRFLFWYPQCVHSFSF